MIETTEIVTLHLPVKRCVFCGAKEALPGEPVTVCTDGTAFHVFHTADEAVEIEAIAA